MNPIFVVVVQVCSDQPVEMAFVQRDDRVEQLAPATADPALGDAVLPGGLDARARRVQAGGLHESGDSAIKRRVMVEQHEACGPSPGNTSRSCCTTHAGVGSRVTLKCRILRRWCSMTKKHESRWKVNVGR